MKTQNTSVNTILQLLGAILLLTMFSSCEKGLLGIRGKGEVVSQDFELSAIHGVNLDLTGNIHIIKSDTQRVTISAQQNIIDNIDMPVDRGIVTFDFQKRVRKCDDVNIYLYVTAMDLVRLNGSGDVTSESLFISATPVDVELNGSGNITLLIDAPELNADITGSGNMELSSHTNSIYGSVSGSGNVTLSGTTHYGEYDISGSGSIHAYRLESETAEVDISGSGNCELTVSSSLKVSIDGSGDVRYRGDASVSSSIDGSGSVSIAD